MAVAGSRCHLRRRVPAPCRRHGHRRGHLQSVQPLAKSVCGETDRIHSARVSGPRDRPRRAASATSPDRVSSPIIMGREHISPWRRTRRRHDAFRRRRKGTWSRSRKLADYIIATNDAQPDGRRSTVDSSLTSGYVSARSDRRGRPASLQGESCSSRHPLGRHRRRPATVLAKDRCDVDMIKR